MLKVLANFLFILNINNHLFFLILRTQGGFLHFSYNIWLIVFVIYSVVQKKKKIYVVFGVNRL
jgi:hypothetical protein